jgi:hypothetical protein
MKYPDWIRPAICAAYQSGITVEAIAEVMARPINSIRWLLSREGVYISKSGKKKQLAVIEETGF